jgi:hypothetical protein
LRAAFAANKKEGTAKNRPFLSNRPNAANYPGEVSASEQGGHLFAAALN